MIVRDMFLVYFKSNKDSDKREPKPSAICPSYTEAIEFCNRMEKELEEYKIVRVPLAIGTKIEPCDKVETKQHIPLDLNKTAYPVKCDRCDSTATYFCNRHSAIYCTNHIVSHGHN